MSKYKAESLRHFYIVPLFWALIIPALIGLIKPKLYFYIDDAISLLVFGLPILVILQVMVDFHLNDKPIVSSIFRKISILPGYFHKTELDIPSIPFVTLSLILINCLFFILWPESLVGKYTFLPIGEASWLQVVLSFFLSAFLHANFSHLFDNMLFFLVFGSVLESRLGWKRLLAAYFFFIFTSNALTLFFLAIKIGSSGASSFADYHGLGASGAISGLMGIFAVRCYFARVTFSFPLLGFIGIPLEVPGVILIGVYFFAFDLIGSTVQFSKNLGVAYWAHVGGYLGGILLGYSLKLHTETTLEALTVKAKRLKKNPLKESRLKRT